MELIESSKSEAVLAETVNMLFKRGEHTNNFLNNMQRNILLQSKETTAENYPRLKEMVDEDLKPKFNFATTKLSSLFKQHLVQHQALTQEAMVSVECQVEIEDDK